LVLIGEGQKGRGGGGFIYVRRRAGRGVEAEAYFHRVWTGSGCSGGRGYFLGHFFGSEGRTFM